VTSPTRSTRVITLKQSFSCGKAGTCLHGFNDIPTWTATAGINWNPGRKAAAQSAMRAAPAGATTPAAQALAVAAATAARENEEESLGGRQQQPLTAARTVCRAGRTRWTAATHLVIPAEPSRPNAVATFKAAVTTFRAESVAVAAEATSRMVDSRLPTVTAVLNQGSQVVDWMRIVAPAATKSLITVRRDVRAAPAAGKGHLSSQCCWSGRCIASSTATAAAGSVPAFHILSPRRPCRVRRSLRCSRGSWCNAKPSEGVWRPADGRAAPSRCCYGPADNAGAAVSVTERAGMVGAAGGGGAAAVRSAGARGFGGFGGGC
jgi:hypothetical protein